MKNGKCSYASLSEDALMIADKQLRKSLFKADFYSHYDILESIGCSDFS